MSKAAQNLDPIELAKFELLADEWWDPDGPFRTLHEINPLRLNYIENHLPLRGRSVLDVGCGGGILSEGMARRGAIVTGIDLAESSLEKARHHAAETGVIIQYTCKDVESMAIENAGTFDVITCLELLEHVPDPHRLVAACSTALAPGGSAFFSTINRNLKSFLFAIVGAEYILQMLPKGTHDYLKLVKPDELVAWCRAASLDVQDLAGLHFNPLTQRYSLGRNIDVNYLSYCTKKGLKCS
ncbi:MAG: bifunctional 2-polyprenyl-6-hydroxyphenol methylase/3-demethylubiquinol 3-O-methyltransferase UbiG [Gammaproteobacteria bacterium]